MAKVVITIEDSEEPGRVALKVNFDPDIDEGTNFTPAQKLALIMFSRANETADPGSFRPETVN